MATEAIVNTANENTIVGPGCDRAVYKAAGQKELLIYRKEHIGVVPEGEAFITPGFRLPARYIIHAVSPLFRDGTSGEEKKLRSCYRRSLEIANEHKITSIAFPLISTGSYGYPREEGMRIAIDEIHSFLLTHDMMVYLVVFGSKATAMGKSIDPKLEAYIDQNYVREKEAEEYGYDRRTERPGTDLRSTDHAASERPDTDLRSPDHAASKRDAPVPHASVGNVSASPLFGKKPQRRPFFEEDEDIDFSMPPVHRRAEESKAEKSSIPPKPPKRTGQKKSLKETLGILPSFPPHTMSLEEEDAAYEELDRQLAKRMAHMSDTFQEYLFYLISEKHLKNADVYKRAIVDKKVFSKIKTNKEYHPKKETALRLCIGAMLNLDESKDLLMRAGYALSPCDKTDIIFSFFIENELYDMIELDIKLEEHGLPCLIE